MTTLIEPLSATFAATSLAVVAARHRHVRVVAGALVAVAIVSVATTIRLVQDDHPGWAGATLLEIAALSVPIMLLVRSPGLTRGLVVCCWLGGLAQSAVILRYLDASLPMSLASMALWLSPAAGAAGAGLYLRALDARRERAVTAAARAQRLELARDLHDFVAHEITGVVVQAQAARTIADRDPIDILGRIEASGLRALEAIDRTLELLRDKPARVDLGTLTELARGFGMPGGTRVRLAADPGALDRLDDEAASTAHRIAVETLTNVRRHAHGAKGVDLVIRSGRRTVVLTVTSDMVLATDTRPRRRAGTGLAHLAERVDALGGHLSAGPVDGARWRVMAELPVAR